MTKSETAWLRKVQAALNDCPNSDWGFYTIGDKDVEIYDKAALKRLGFFDNDDDLVNAIQNAEFESGEVISVATLRFPTQVEGVCG